MNEQTVQDRARTGNGRTGSGADTPSAAGLAARALDQSRALMRRELDLARAEADASMTRLGAALGLLAGALVLALVALNVLAGALVVALAEVGVDPAWGAVIVGLALAVIAAIMVGIATKQLRDVKLAPNRVAGSVREDARMAKEAVK